MTSYPPGKFRCLICGEVRDNQKYIRYSKPEEHKSTIKEALAELEKYGCILVSHARTMEALRRFEPNMEIYRFTVCHGYFVRVK